LKTILQHSADRRLHVQNAFSVLLQKLKSLQLLHLCARSKTELRTADEARRLPLEDYAKFRALTFAVKYRRSGKTRDGIERVTEVRHYIMLM
jgi:hypothetical protein